MPLLKSLLPGKGLGQGGAKLQEWREGHMQGSGARAGRTKQLPRPSTICRTPSGGQDTKRQETAGV